MPKGQLAIKLIDYDGMYVPALEGTKSGELGHAAYQHPQRFNERTYSADVDRFSHLVIYTAVDCLKRGGRDLWRQFNNDDNLLFRETDFRRPGASTLFQFLWNFGDEQGRAMVGRLMLACLQRLEEVPWLDNLVVKGSVQPLSRDEERQVAQMLSVGQATARSGMREHSGGLADGHGEGGPAATSASPPRCRPRQLHPPQPQPAPARRPQKGRCRQPRRWAAAYAPWGNRSGEDLPPRSVLSTGSSAISSANRTTFSATLSGPLFRCCSLWRSGPGSGHQTVARRQVSPLL